MAAVCGILPSFDSFRNTRRCRTRQAVHESPVHLVVPIESDIHRHEDAAQSPQADKSRTYIRELASPSHEDFSFTGAFKTHSDADCLASPTIFSTPCGLLDDHCMNLNQIHIHTDEHDLSRDPLSALLHGSRSPLAKYCEDAQKLAWLKAQLIGENQEFVTPFGKRHLVYADHTASGRSLFFVEDFIARYLLPCYGNTHTDDSYVGRRTSKMMKQAENYVKEKLGGSTDDVLVMCGWGSTAAIKRLQEVMGITVPSNLRACVLDMMQASASEDQERWLVFTGPYEHHSNLLLWRQSLAEVIEIPANEEGEIDLGR